MLYEVEYYLQYQGTIGLFDIKYYRTKDKAKKFKDRFIIHKNYKLFRYITEYEEKGNC
jgi:hypothetical protein